MRNERALLKVQLTETEMALIRRMRTNEQQWDRVRWALVVTSSIVFAGSIFMFRQIWSAFAFDTILVIVCVLVAPVSGITLVASLAGLMHASVRWGGCPARRLLLRLADELEFRENGNP